MSSVGESELATTLEGIVREEQCGAFTGDIDCPHCVSFPVPSAALLHHARPLTLDLSPPSPANPHRLPIHHMRLQRPPHIGQCLHVLSHSLPTSSSPLQFHIHRRARGPGRPSIPILPSLTLPSGTAPRARARRGEVPDTSPTYP
jgi:hypothetical protein